jgi:hypothetical protein
MTGGMVLMHRFCRLSSLVGFVVAQDESAGHHTDRHPAEQTIDVLITLRFNLLIELLVDISSGHESWFRPFAGTAEEGGQRVHLVYDRGVARLPGCMASCRRARCKRERLMTMAPVTAMKMSAPTISNGVDHPRDLVARFPGNPDICGVGDVHEGERNCEHLTSPHPRGETEGLA